MTALPGEPHGSDERLTLPVGEREAAEFAAEMYAPPAKRSVRLLRLGTEDIGHYRLVSLSTEVTPGGYQRLAGVFQRVFL